MQTDRQFAQDIPENGYFGESEKRPAKSRRTTKGPCGYGNGWTIARDYRSQKQTAHRSEPFVVVRGVI